MPDLCQVDDTEVIKSRVQYKSMPAIILLPFSSKNIFHHWLYDNSSEDVMMLHFVSRGRCTDTAGRGGFSFSSNAFPCASSGSYQKQLPAVCCGDSPGLHPHLFSATPPGWVFSESQTPSGELPASVHLYPEGKRCFLLAGSASPLAVSCLPSKSRPALARATHRMSPYFIATPSSTQSESQIAEGTPSQHILSFILFLCPRYSLEFSLLLSR